ncbi:MULTISPECIES: hypothetical protein [unclassified Agarivorans]|uniref:hypothetical protein n=1 Tax=unclassified Agarivorans TaxID=2636026 RepID=UPI0026E2660F|nr:MULTISPECIES: hypothetical protein [unclassified Agarivorans]MDO6683849.1 hypothetical protein [Agarivorans sp. 3_MG-2023]MDO6714418.1 hypothetical protein [Agarivorans sp. 2_MG-2023]
MTQAGSFADERRRFYRIVYPVRLIQLLIKMVNTKIANVAPQGRQKSDVKDAFAAQFMPMMYLGDHVFPVLDVSEGGCRIQWRSSAEPLPISSKILIGRLIFHQDLSKIVDYLPKDVQEEFEDLSLLYSTEGYEHQFEARICRKIENKRDPYPQLCLQFTKNTHISARFIRQQESTLIKLFRDQYIERVRLRRKQLKDAQQK